MAFGEVMTEQYDLRVKNQKLKRECVEGLRDLINEGTIFIRRNHELSTDFSLGVAHWRKLYELVGGVGCWQMKKK